MKTSLWELQQSLFARLSGDERLSSKVTGVYDYVDENTPYPYVTIGDPVVVPFSTKTSKGEETTVTIHCFSDYKGKKEAYEILTLILQSISRELLTVNGFTLFRMELERMTVFPDINNEVYHGIVTFKIWINN